MELKGAKINRLVYSRGGFVMEPVTEIFVCSLETLLMIWVIYMRDHSMPNVEQDPFKLFALWWLNWKNWY